MAPNVYPKLTPGLSIVLACVCFLFVASLLCIELRGAPSVAARVVATLNLGCAERIYLVPEPLIGNPLESPNPLAEVQRSRVPEVPHGPQGPPPPVDAARFKYLATEAACSTLTRAAKLNAEPFASRRYTAFETTKKCSLALVAAGFPRSGSTLQMALLEAAGSMIVDKSMITTHWNAHLHDPRCRPGNIELKDNLVYCNELQSTYAAQIIKLKNFAAPSIILVKPHEFDTQILKLCQKRIILTTHRNLLDVAESAYMLKWIGSLDGLFQLLDASIRDHECWKMAGAVDIPYELYSEDVEEYALRVLSIVAADYGTESHFSIRSHALAAYVSKFIGRDANPKLPSTKGPHGDQLPAEWIGPILDRYETWFEKYNYTLAFA